MSHDGLYEKAHDKAAEEARVAAEKKADEQQFKPGDWVRKKKGYKYVGRVAAAYRKFDNELREQTGPWRYDVQNRDGMLHIFGDDLEAYMPDLQLLDRINRLEAFSWFALRNGNYYVGDDCMTDVKAVTKAIRDGAV
jgi:hypothetical protein